MVSQKTATAGIFEGRVATKLENSLLAKFVLGELDSVKGVAAVAEENWWSNSCSSARALLKWGSRLRAES